jgi:multiple sugar transport system permease protein
MAAFVRANRPGSVVFRTAFFLPFIVGLATESFMLLLELQPDSGVVDTVLGKLGLASVTTAWTVHYDLALSLIISVIGSFLAFNQFYCILTEGGPGTSTEPIVMWIYQEAFIAYHRPASSGHRPAGLAVFLTVGTIASLLFVLPLAWGVFRPRTTAQASEGTTLWLTSGAR